jgi:Integrase core domain
LFVDSFKTELIADRIWRSRSQLEVTIVEYLGWFNNARLHESLGDIPVGCQNSVLAARNQPASRSCRSATALRGAIIRVAFGRRPVHRMERLWSLAGATRGNRWQIRGA